jgi:hypothetical protein
VMLVAEYAKTFSRTNTRPFLLTCLAWANLGSATLALCVQFIAHYHGGNFQPAPSHG